MSFSEKKNPSLNDDGKLLSLYMQAYETASEETETKLFVMKGKTYAGRLPHAIATGFVADKGFLLPKHLAKGHGEPHQPNECLPIEQYLEGIGILSGIMLYLTV